jgi:hypothetical protein
MLLCPVLSNYNRLKFGKNQKFQLLINNTNIIKIKIKFVVIVQYELTFISLFAITYTINDFY